ncbi:MAG: AAA family ATPase [Rhodospirillales bacterium]|nr:AAA family ATPase [Rhodospirillales bacterium]
MELISKLEIAYFRSIYSATLHSCTDLNALIGGNDAGKSNILKALNLFLIMKQI